MGGRPLSEDEKKNMFVTFKKIGKRCGKLKTHYTCLICAHVVSGQQNIDAHINFHTGKNLYQCSVCKKKFGHRISLENHMRIHTGEKSYECSYCHKKFANSSSLRNHIKNCPPESLTIGLGSITQQTVENIMVVDHPRSHLSAVHETDSFSFSNYDTAENEESDKTESTQDVLTCQFCRTDFLHDFELDIHLQCCSKQVEAARITDHETEDEETYRCEICGENFDELDLLKKHDMDHSLENDSDLAGSQMTHQSGPFGDFFEEPNSDLNSELIVKEEAEDIKDPITNILEECSMDGQC